MWWGWFLPKSQDGHDAFDADWNMDTIGYLVRIKACVLVSFFERYNQPTTRDITPQDNIQIKGRF